jgi:WD40 repeat protein
MAGGMMVLAVLMMDQRPAASGVTITRKPVWTSEDTFVVSRGGQDHDSIVLYRVADSAMVRVSECPVPRGVVCVSSLPDHPGALVVSAEHSARIGILDTRSRKISWLPGRGMYPVVDAHGEHIAAIWPTEKGVDLFIWDVARRRRVRITRGLHVRSHFQWSPEGDEIAFVASRFVWPGPWLRRLVGISSADGRHSDLFGRENHQAQVYELTWSDKTHLLLISISNDLKTNLIKMDRLSGKEKVVMADLAHLVRVGSVSDISFRRGLVQGTWRGAYVVFPVGVPSARIARLDTTTREVSYVDFGEEVTGCWAPSPSGSCCAAVTGAGKVLVRAWR